MLFGSVSPLLPPTCEPAPPWQNTKLSAFSKNGMTAPEKDIFSHFSPSLSYPLVSGLSPK